MAFLNETLHPKASSLVAHIMLAAVKKDKAEPTFYQPLEQWRVAQGLTDDKAADLYARIEEAFDGKFLELTAGQRVSTVSRCLWESDEVLA